MTTNTSTPANPSKSQSEVRNRIWSRVRAPGECNTVETLRDHVTTVNRIHKLLETANIKLGGVVTDIMGVAGRAMLAALVTGERNPTVLAGLARGTLVHKASRLVEALAGRFTEHHAFLLDQLLRQVDHLARLVTACDARIEATLMPHATKRAAASDESLAWAGEVLISEIGVDMTPLRLVGVPGLVGSALSGDT